MWLRLERARRLRVGGLGVVAFRPGYYAYVGSAFGPGGVRSRLGRHFRLQKKKRWHIDYLRSVCHLEAAWVCYESQRLEHQWADLLRGLAGAWLPVVHFGSSDCRCEAHLAGFSKPPSIRAFLDKAGHRGPGVGIDELIL